jgi:hypothetical protein
MLKTHLPLAALLIGISFATVAATPPAVNAEQAQSQSTSPQNPAEQIPMTLQALEDAKAGEYGKLRAEDKQQLEAADREIKLLIGDHDDLAKLDEQERMRLFNAQETVMAVVSGLKRNQLVCTYRANSGTRFKTKHCMTREMADAMKKAAKDTTHSAQNPMCVPGEGNSC